MNTRGPGDAQYPPAMLLGLLVSIYASATSGFYGEEAVRKIEQTAVGAPTGTTVYAAMEKTSHHRSVADLEKTPAPEASPGEKMRHRLQTQAGKNVYRLRQQSVEPVFGIIKSAMGFRQLLLRGRAKGATEWTLVCLAYNSRRLHALKPAANLSPGG